MKLWQAVFQLTPGDVPLAFQYIGSVGTEFYITQTEFA